MPDLGGLQLVKKRVEVLRSIIYFLVEFLVMPEKACELSSGFKLQKATGGKTKYDLMIIPMTG